MKTKLSFLARSVILLWMLVVGSSNAWAEWAEVSYDGNTYIYFNNIKPSGWDVCWKAAGSNVYAYFYNAGGGEQWTEWAAELVSGTQDAEGAVYRIKVPQGTWKAVILSRGTATGWDGRWNEEDSQTNDIFLYADKNYLKNYGKKGTEVSAEWDNYSTTASWKLHYNDGTGWPDLDLTTTDGKIYTGTLHIDADTEFKVWAEGRSWYGNNGTMTRDDCSGWDMTTSGGNCKLTADVTGDYIFTFDESTMKLSVTYPEKTNLHLWHNTAIDDVWDAKELNGGNCTISGDGRGVFYFTFGNGNSVDWSKAWRTPNAENTEITFGNTYSKSPAYGTEGVWFTNDFKTGYDYTFTVNEDAGTFTVTKAEKTYPVTVSAGDHGSVSPSGATQVGASGVSITATPASGYTFNEWQTTGNVTVADAHSATTTITATGEGTVTATFVEASFVEKNIYVQGRFKIRKADGVEEYIWTGSSDTEWNTNSTNIKFTYDDVSGLYKLNTYCTLSELSANSGGGSGAKYYFHLKIDGKDYGRDNGSEDVPLGTPANINIKEGSTNFVFNKEGKALVTLVYDADAKKLWYETDITNTTPVKIEVGEDIVQWSYSVNGGTPIYVMDGHKSEYVYLPVGDNVTLTISKIDNTGNETTETKTYKVKDEGDVITVYWDNYQPKCTESDHNTDTKYKEPTLDQAWIWYERWEDGKKVEKEGDDSYFSASDHQGARLDTDGRFLYANVSVRPGNYMILFRSNASDVNWKDYGQTVEFTGEDANSDYGPVKTTGTNTFKVQNTHKESSTQQKEERQMWEVDYFDPESFVTFNPSTVTKTKVGNKTTTVGTKATIYDNATVTITPENVTSWRYKLNNGTYSEWLHSTSEDLDIAKLIDEHKINASTTGIDNDITVELVYALNSAKSISKEVTATYTVKKPEAKVNVHVSFPYGIWHETDGFNEAANWRIAYVGQNGSETSVTESAFASLKKDVTMTENDPKFYEWYSTSVAVAGSDVQKIRVDLQDNETWCATKVAENGSDVYFVVVYNHEDNTSTHTTEKDAIDAEVPLPVITATPSQTFIGTEDASASYEVSKAESATVTVNGGEPSTAMSGNITVPKDGTTTMTINAVNSAGYPMEVTRTYDVKSSDHLSGYYLVVNNTRSASKAGTNIVKYKFQPVLNRGKVDADLSSTLYTLTLPDFVLTGAQGRAENPDCFTATLDDQPTMYYTIQKGDGSVIYQPTSSTTYGDTYYAGHNEDGNKYLYIWNEKEPNKEHYISVNGADRVMMTKDDNMRINGHGPIWYYNFGDGDQSTKYFNVTIEYNPGNVLTNWYLYGGNNSTFVEAKLDGTWSGTAIIAPDEVKTITPGKNYELGYEEGKKFTEKPNGGLTNVQMESYGAHINKSKAAADAEGYNFFLKKDKLAKSYTWYLNIGNSAYAPSDHNPRFTSNAQSVAIAANQLVDGHAKNAIVEQKVINDDSKVQDYYLTGNLKAGAGAMTWQPVENKMKMTRMFFANKGKSYVAGNSEGITAENCDSIVYVLQMVRPEAGWGNMYLSMAGERNLNAYSNGISSSNTEAWWATLIRPQVFTDKDAQWNFGGLEVNGILKDDGKYTTSYANTSQAINPILDNTVTGYTAYFNMTNATYRLVYYTESESNDEGLFIIGPAVGETTAEHPYNAKDGQKVKLTFDAPTGAYVAKNVKLTYDKKFRFANIKASTITTTTEGGGSNTEEVAKYESYYDEDAIVPARDGEPGNTDWLTAKTWETDYFNILSKQKNVGEVETLDDSDDAAVTFKLPTGTYNVRFYTKYLGANGETVTNAYYTIDYHIGIGDAAANKTDLSKGAGSAFAFHKTWSSRLAYVNNGLDAYYVSGWNWNKDEQKKTATASVTLSILDKPAYLAAEMPMILTDEAKNESKLYVIVPGDPYGYQAAVKACYHENTGIEVRPIYETEDYTTGMNATEGSSEWKEWCTKVGPGDYDTEAKAYKSRNFIFGMISPNWRTDGKKELDFWRVKNTNNKMTGHKFLVVATVPEGTKDLESGKAFSSYQSGSEAKSMANYMTIRFEGEDDEEDSIVTGIAENVTEKADNGRIYNLMGVEVKTPVRGQVYIVNGRKVIMK